MARREENDFLKRLFDEPAGGKSPKGRPSKRSRPEESRARLLAVLEAAAERSDEGIVLDDALLAAYLDGALGNEEQVALEGLLAGSADLRDQLAAAGETRAAALDNRAKMPKAFIEDFDAVPAPPSGKLVRKAEAPRTRALPRWLAAIAPGRSWAMAALPAIIAVVVVAVIGPAVYGPEEPQAPKPAIRETMADKDVKSRSSAGKRRSKYVGKEKPPQTGARADLLRKRPRGGSSGAGQSGRLESKDRVLTSALIPLDDKLRAALIRMGLRQNRRLTAARSVYDRAGAKREAAKPVAPKSPAKIAEARKKREAKPKSDRQALKRQAKLPAQKRYFSNRPAVLKKPVDKAIVKNCPGGAAMCCERRRIDPKLLRRLQASEPPLQSMAVLHLSSKTCLLTLPGAVTGN